MILALINALAMAPGTATSGPSQHIHDLNTILNQVEKFYGQGWHSLSMENAAIFAVAAAVITVIGVVVGALVPILINNRAEKRMLRQIALAQRKARVNTERELGSAKDQMAKELQSAKDEMESRITDAMSRLATYIDAAMEKMRHFSNANGFLLKFDSCAAHFGNTGQRDSLLSAIENAYLASFFFFLADEQDQANVTETQAKPMLNQLAPAEAKCLLDKLSSWTNLPIPEKAQKALGRIIDSIRKQAEAPTQA